MAYRSLAVGAVLLTCLWGRLERAGAVSIQPGQVDDFEAGVTMQWQEGPTSPNPPEVVASGGPDGAGDAFLRNASSGGFGAGGRQVMFNSDQWSGDYLSAGVTAIAMDVANLGQSNLSVRIALGQGAISQTATWYASATPFELPSDGAWRRAEFALDTENLVCVNGACGTTALSDLLADVTTLRIVSAAGGPDFRGDRIASTLGVDNITAVAAAGPLIGDMDGDGDIDFDDIGPFVTGINDPAGYEEAFGVPPSDRGDTDGDGDFDFDDIPGFVELLGGGSIGQAGGAVPEPATAALLAVALLVVCGRRRRAASSL